MPVELDLQDEMIDRAARNLYDQGFGFDPDSNPKAARAVAYDVLRAAFEGVPISNYAIGLLLQHFELVIVALEGASFAPQVGVYRLNGEPGSFDSVGHTLDVSWGDKPRRFISRVSVSKLDPPDAASDDKQGRDE